MSATEGWSDADGLTLQYQFSYTKDTGADAKYFSYAPQASLSFITQLPTGNVTIRVRCINIYGGYSEAFERVTVNAPTAVDVSELGDKITNLVDEQNTGQLIALASTFVATLTAAGSELTDDQMKLQMQMTDSVRYIPDLPFHKVFR